MTSFREFLVEHSQTGPAWFGEYCQICGRPFAEEVYMVNDALWSKAGMKNGDAHIECFENKLGRRLNANDFTQYANAPANRHNPKVQQRLSIV